MRLKTNMNRRLDRGRMVRLPGILFLVVFVLGMQSAFSQSTTITGTVRSAEEGPLPGVSVILKGTTQGTTTDIDGRYSINASPGSTLVFSFIGYAQQEVPVGTQTTVDVVLQTDTRQLEEVVVTAFGLEREKKALGYSVQEVSGEALQEAREVNVANSLKGKIAGVHVNPTSGGPGGSTFIVIRGASSLAGNNAPLIVVDGVPIDNQTLGGSDGFSGIDYGDGISNINPDDIESVSVLKGPSAASLYGARGATGVILITTKTGRGRKKGVGVDFNSNATFESINMIPTFQNEWGAGYDDDYSALEETTVDGQQVWMYRNSLDQWGGRLDGRPIVYQAAPEWGIQSYSPQPEDNIRNFYRTGSTFTNTVSITGSGDKGSVRLSLSDLRNQSIVPNSSFDRQTVNLRAQYQVSDKLLVDAKVNYVRQGGNNRVNNGVSYTSVPASLNLIPRFVDLNLLKDHTKENGDMKNFRNGSAPLNPYWLVEKYKNEDTRDRIIGMARVKYDITPWLSIQGRTGTDFYTENRFALVPQGTPGGNNPKGQVTNDLWTAKEDNHDVLATAQGNLSADFTGSFSLGASHQSRYHERLRTHGYDLNIPGLYHIGNAGSLSVSNSISRRKMNSVYFMGQLGYKNFLFLDVTGRNDWSSTLGVNNQSFFYPSVSASFAFTDAIELTSNVLTFGKVRASWAQAGNDASPYMTRGGYSIHAITNNYNGYRMASIQDRIPLTDLKNELTSSYEIGADLRFFNNRVALDFTYYNQSTTNQILSIAVPAATGFANRVINAGEVRNQGFEVMLNATAVRAGDFAWDLGINWSRNRSTVESLAPGINAHQLLYSISDMTIEARVGEAFGNIIGYNTMRNEDGRVVVSDQGKWQRGELTILGNVQPEWLAGVTNTFSYKNFVLSGLIDVRRGGQIVSGTKYDQMGKGTGKFTEVRENLVIDGVIDNGDGTYRENDIVILAQDYYAGGGPWGGPGENMVIDADYISLRELSFGYNFGSRFLGRTPFTGLRLSVVGRNLGYLSMDDEFKVMGVSPETAFSNTAAAQGHETRGLPTTRSIGFNLSLSF